MKVRLLYFARLREAFGRSSEVVELADPSPTVGTLIESLRGRGGGWAAELVQGRAWRVAVNQEMAGPDTALAAGDEVAIFPPVTGG